MSQVSSIGSVHHFCLCIALECVVQVATLREFDYSEAKIDIDFHSKVVG